MFSSSSDRALSEIAVASVPFNSSPKNLTQKIRAINILLAKYFVLANYRAGCAICRDGPNGENDAQNDNDQKNYEQIPISILIHGADHPGAGPVGQHDPSG